VLEDAALEILLELPADELRQPARVVYALAEPGPALSDRLVERRLFGPTARVAIGTNPRPGVSKAMRRVSHGNTPSPNACPARSTGVGPGHVNGLDQTDAFSALPIWCPRSNHASR
jgi:hypothetical protein